MGITKQRERPKGRRCSAEEKAQAVRLVWTLRDELGTSHGTVQRVANQLGSAPALLDILTCPTKSLLLACCIRALMKDSTHARDSLGIHGLGALRT